ncbi:MAG: hypothetical protein IBX68_05190 [Dehalococcoidia bacterium]|nr:hypothetical protein [Dehalococcoidia bacterium]
MSEDTRIPLSENCIHHWIIGSDSVGICKKCGAHQHFCNSWEQAISQKVWARKAAKTAQGPVNK